jgi:predicted hydrolase (HD superfamily)
MSVTVLAVALVRPSKNIAEVDVKSIKKKWKMKAFAPGVNREEVEAGAAALGVPLDEHIERVLAGMQAAAAALGLDGSAASPA